jgi:hypothetical protein
VGGDVLINNETLLVTDFVNLKIKLAQSFKDAHKDKMCVFIGVSGRTYMNICVFTVFLKNLLPYSIDNKKEEKLRVIITI